MRLFTAGRKSHDDPNDLQDFASRRSSRLWPRRNWTGKRTLAVGLVPILVLGILFAYIGLRWPYSENVLIPALEDAFKTEVSFQHFRRRYFPHPGCEAEYVTLTRAKGPAAIPLATVQKMIIAGRYKDLFFHPHHLAGVQLDGLYVKIAPQTLGEPQPSSGASIEQISIGSVTTRNGVLEISRGSKKEALKFEVHWLLVKSIAAGQPMSYSLRTGIPEPPGEVESDGLLGPWRSGNIGATDLRSFITLRDAKLEKYDGICGSVRATQHAIGTLEQLHVSGHGTAANFCVKSAGHLVDLSADYQLTVNAMRGEVQLQDVIAKMGQTTARIRGEIKKTPQLGRRETVLDFTITRGRVNDVLWLFSSAPKPRMIGSASGSGHVVAPKLGPGFLINLLMSGQFEVQQGQFQGEMQAKANQLSARAQGTKLKKLEEPPEVPVERLASGVTMQRAIAHLSGLYFQVPGAEAHMNGTYDFLNKKIDLHGNLQTDVSVSKTNSGIKSVLLKPLDPIFRKKPHGAEVPVVMNGFIDEPHFGIAIPPK